MRLMVSTHNYTHCAPQTVWLGWRELPVVVNNILAKPPPGRGMLSLDETNQMLFTATQGVMPVWNTDDPSYSQNPQVYDE